MLLFELANALYNARVGLGCITNSLNIANTRLCVIHVLHGSYIPPLRERRVVIRQA